MILGHILDSDATLGRIETEPINYLLTDNILKIERKEYRPHCLIVLLQNEVKNRILQFWKYRLPPLNDSFLIVIGRKRQINMGLHFTFRVRDPFFSFGQKAPKLTTARGRTCLAYNSFFTIFFFFDLKMKDRLDSWPKCSPLKKLSTT